MRDVQHLHTHCCRNRVVKCEISLRQVACLKGLRECERCFLSDDSVRAR